MTENQFKQSCYASESIRGWRYLLMNAAELIQAREQLQGNDDFYQSKVVKHYRNDGLSFDERVSGMNKTAEVRADLLSKLNKNSDDILIGEFLDYLRNENNRIYQMIYYLAEIEKEKNGIDYLLLKRKDKIKIINALHQIKVLSALIPNKLAMPI
ncbi:TPA: DUF5347 family protein [Proteus mirabilis]|uniref:DUF5347 family protein n=1 Tax=Proteus mirabilis TaxID=584 RepID=UPI00202408B4